MQDTQQFWVLEITAVVAVMVMCLLIYTIRQNTLMLKRLSGTESDDSHSDTDVNEGFNARQAERWFEQGDMQSLSRYCEQFIQNAPNSVHANWFYALSHYNQGDYTIAREYFENVIRINPLWREGAVVYLLEIAEKIGRPEQLTIH